MNTQSLSKQEKIEILSLVLFLSINVLLHFFNHNGLVIEFSILILVFLLFIWIKHSIVYIEKTTKSKYNTFMLVLSIYGKSVSLLSFAFWLIEMPFYKEILIVAKVSMLIYIIISLINKEYRNALWGLVYKII
jgi:hypothetical protein